MLKDERMRAICSLVNDGGCVCDVGTDHAFVPIELVSSGRCKSAVITDISLPSLEKGIDNVKKNGLSDKISACHCNGTLGIDVSSITDIVIAGMGGELIASIIDNDKRLCDGKINLILQPMSRAEELRRYLFTHGFKTDRELRVRSEGRLYTIITARYTGENTEFTSRELYLGAEHGDALLDREYAEWVKKGLETKLYGLIEGGKTEEAEKIRKMIGEM